MKFSFELPQDNTNTDLPESKEFRVGEIQKNLEGSAETDLRRFEESDDDFIEREKKKHNIGENENQLESQIAGVKKRYETTKDSLKSTFLSKLRTVSKYATGSMIALSLTVQAAKQEYPDYLGKKKEAQKIEWNVSTQEEIHRLASEYASIMKQDPAYREISEEVFKNRFVNFVKAYGSDINIVHPEGDIDLKDKVVGWTFENVLKQPSSRIHYFNKTLFYEKAVFPEDKKEGIYTSNLGDFFSEFAHHLNQDWTWSRSCAYVEDLARRGFVQEKMYEDPYSSEYQAHTITEIAISIYLAPWDKNLNVSFADIYNVLQELYRGFTKTRDWEHGHEQMNDLLLYALQGENLPEMSKNKEVILGNLENLRNAIENECSDLSNDQKGNIFESIVDQVTGDSNLLRVSNLDVTNFVLQEKALLGE